MEHIEPIKYAWDQLNDIAQMELTQAIGKHREVEPGLGYPYAFWTEWSLEAGESMCVEYFIPDENRTHWYHYKKENGHWAWW